MNKRFNLDFVAEGTKVKLIVTLAAYPLYNWSYTFVIDVGYEPYAKLLAAHFTTEMRERFEHIRRVTYERGWKDAKAKRMKNKHFMGGWWEVED